MYEYEVDLKRGQDFWRLEAWIEFPVRIAVRNYAGWMYVAQVCIVHGLL